MDDRINYVALFITLGSPTLGLFLLAAQDMLNDSYAFNNKNKFVRINLLCVLILSVACVFSYILYESSMPSEYNIRVDLFLAYPALVVVFVNVGEALSMMKPKSDE